MSPLPCSRAVNRCLWAEGLPWREMLAHSGHFVPMVTVRV